MDCKGKYPHYPLLHLYQYQWFHKGHKEKHPHYPLLHLHLYRGFHKGHKEIDQKDIGHIYLLPYHSHYPINRLHLGSNKTVLV